MKTIQWTATKAEFETIRQIVKRAEKLVNGLDRMAITMDLEACHCNGCPLDLERLLTFPDFDFLHDIGGIRRHLNRETGELQNCFLPRCSRHDTELNHFRKTGTLAPVS